MSAYRLEDLIEVDRFQILQDRLNRIYPFPSAIIDTQGKVLTATGWQDVCTKFHRAHPEAGAACVESDRHVLARLREGDTAATYRCPHGLIDNAVPIVIEGVHYGNFFTGQFFLEPPDLGSFREQARRYGFDEAAYLEAVRKVPVWSPAQLAEYLLFIRELIGVISTAGLKKLREVAERERSVARENLLAGILNAVPQSIFWKDGAGRYLGCNEAFARAVGVGGPGQIVGKTDFDLPWPRAEAEAYRADDREVIAGRQPKRHIIEPLQQADGARLWIDTTKVPLLDGAGEPWGVLGVYDDVTERRRAEAELRTRERQLAESQRIAHVGSWEHNTRTGEVFWSDELFRLLGLDPRRDPGDFRMFFSMVHPDDQPVLRRAIETTLRERTPFDIEYRFVYRDGATRVIHAQAELIADESGELVVLSGTAQDVTARKEAEERLRQSEEFVRCILDTVDEGFIVVDRDYRIVTANSAYRSQVGRAGDIVGRSCHEVSHGTARPCHEHGEECAVRHVFATGEPRTAVHRHRGAHGETMFVETRAYPIRDAAGNVASVIETITNITERHLLEEERLKSQKLESIGTLAGGIAHDFNNLLQGIFGYISMARLAADRPGRVEEMLGQAEEALRLAVGLTTQLLTFSKGGKPVRRRIRLEPVLENAARFALSGSSTEHRLEIEPGLWPVEADAGQLSQVVQNVVLNANEAMGGRGTVHIAVGNARLARGEVAGLARGGRFVRVEIRDTGAGIPERELERVFDPYFTTKDRGSGLGLATSYSIVTNHGGAIAVTSAPGRGSTFTIHLPAAEGAGAEEDAAPPPPAVAAVARRGRILLMDDEDLVRNVAREMVEALGHDVHCAADGEEALELFRAAREGGNPFDVVILDLTVRGGMGGAEAVRKLRELDPAVAAVVSSGYADNAVVADHEAHGFTALLSKPYKFESLKVCLDGLIGRN